MNEVVMEEKNVKEESKVNPSLQSKFEKIAQSKEIVETKRKKCFVLMIFLYK